MAVQRFTYYAHDTYEYGETEEHLKDQGLSHVDASQIAQQIRGIEVALDYEYDTVTKVLTLVQTRLA